MSAMFLPGSRNCRKCFRESIFIAWPKVIGRLEIANVLEAVMDWIGPSSNGLSKCKNNQAKFIWFTYMVHMVFTSRDWFQHYLSLFTLIQARKCWISKTLTLAGDMQWTNTPSSIIPLSNLNFSSLVFREKLNVSQTKHYLLWIRNENDWIILEAVSQKYNWIFQSSLRF